MLLREGPSEPIYNVLRRSGSLPRTIVSYAAVAPKIKLLVVEREQLVTKQGKSQLL